MRNLALALELRRWRRAGRTARLWWRDDDAAGASAALDRLLGLAQAAAVPVTLAVVPAGDMASLEAGLATSRASAMGLVSLVQHGVDHQNRRSGPAAGEFPHNWPQAELELALRRGWDLIKAMPWARPIYVPPWNDAHPALEAALIACGYEGWSVNGALGASDGAGQGLPRVDAHLDLLRWRGGGRFRGTGRFLRDLTTELRRRREAGLWAAPIGLLTHHLAHDPAAWAFLAHFLAWTAARGEFTWAALPALIDEAEAGRAANDRPPPARRAPVLSLAVT